MMARNYFLELYEIELKPPADLPDTNIKKNSMIIGYNNFGTRFLIEFKDSNDNKHFAVYTFDMVLEEYNLDNIAFKHLMFLRYIFILLFNFRFKLLV